MDYRLAFIILAIVFFVFAVFVLWTFWRILKQREREHNAIEQLLIALGEAVQALDTFAQEEHRTMESLGGVGSFTNERHPAVRNAKMRGFEVYRNDYVERHQQKLKSSLKVYNEHAEELLGVLGYTVIEENGMKTVVKPEKS